MRGFYRAAQKSELLIVMGGPIGFCDAPDFAFLAIEVDLIRARLQATRAMLGICLESQLMAAALGTKIFPESSGVELGWASDRLTEAARLHAVWDCRRSFAGIALAWRYV